MENQILSNSKSPTVFIGESKVNIDLILEWICAARNTNDITLYIGFENQNGRIVLKGVEEFESVKKSILDILRCDSRISYHSYLSSDLIVKEDKEKKGLILTVREAPSEEKPVKIFDTLSYAFTPASGVHEIVSKDLRILENIKNPYRADTSELSQFSASILQTNAYLSFREIFFKNHGDYRHKTPKEFMSLLSFGTADFHPTYAGAIFFGSDALLRDIQPGLTYKLIILKNADSQVFSPQDGSFEGGALSFYQFAIKKFKETYPKESDREFSNALCYAITNANYEENEPLIVTFSKEKAEISFQGIRGYFRLPLHPLLSNWFLMIGVGKPYSAYKSPYVFDSLNSTYSTIFSFEKTKEDSVNAKAASRRKVEDAIYKKYASIFKEPLVSHLAQFEKETGVNVFGRTEILNATEVSPATATSIIKKMEKSKVIKPIKGQGKGKYRFRKAFLFLVFLAFLLFS